MIEVDITAKNVVAETLKNNAFSQFSFDVKFFLKLFAKHNVCNLYKT